MFQIIFHILYFQLTPIGTTIFRAMSATDKDVGRNQDIDFQIVRGKGGPVSLQTMVTISNSLLNFHMLILHFEHTFSILIYQ